MGVTLSPQVGEGAGPLAPQWFESHQNTAVPGSVWVWHGAGRLHTGIMHPDRAPPYWGPGIVGQRARPLWERLTLGGGGGGQPGGGRDQGMTVGRTCRQDKDKEGPGWTQGEEEPWAPGQGDPVAGGAA